MTIRSDGSKSVGSRPDIYVGVILLSTTNSNLSIEYATLLIVIAVSPASENMYGRFAKSGAVDNDPPPANVADFPTKSSFKSTFFPGDPDSVIFEKRPTYVDSFVNVSTTTVTSCMISVSVVPVAAVNTNGRINAISAGVGCIVIDPPICVWPSATRSICRVRVPRRPSSSTICFCSVMSHETNSTHVPPIESRVFQPGISVYV